MNQTELSKNIQEINIQKMIVMGLAPVLLFFSFFLSVFTPYPIGLSSVLYGRKVSGIVTGITVLAFVVLMLFTFDGMDVSLSIFFALSLILGLGISEVVKKDINPVLGIVAIGAIVSFIAGLFVFLSLASQQLSLKETIVQEIERLKPQLEEQQKALAASGEKGTFEMMAILGQPDVLAAEVIKLAPSYFLVTLFITLWVNFFMVLKSNRLVRGEAKYTEQSMLNYQVPDQVIWAVIAFLGFYLLEEQPGFEYMGAIGLAGLSVLGVFYFFQGFGIYLAFLDNYKITGFFRTLLVVTTVMMANKMIALIGLINMFVDFKKLMKKNDSGE